MTATTVTVTKTETPLLQTTTSTNNNKSEIRTEKLKKKNVTNMLKRRFSFSLKKTMSASKRSLTPMRRRPSSADTSSLTSVGSNSLDLDQKCVRFEPEGRSKTKVKVHVRTFEKSSPDEVPHLWYTEADMLDIIDDIKVIVRHYHRRCDRYRSVIDRVATHCAAASIQNDSITNQLDARVLEQLANADARGLEHHILSNGGAADGASTRKDIIRQVILAQDAHYSSSPTVREKAMADKYTALAHSAKLWAKTMGDGDAFVASTVAAAADAPAATPVSAVTVAA